MLEHNEDLNKPYRERFIINFVKSRQGSSCFTFDVFYV
jgi:hypothetical protein